MKTSITKKHAGHAPALAQKQQLGSQGGLVNAHVVGAADAG